MKREIKFRAWHKATKTMLNKWPYEWREGIYRSNGEKHLFADNTFKFSEDKKKCNRTTGKSVFISLDGFLCGLIPIDEETTRSINYSDEYDLMQFTGLLDKNGKEIYDNDIIKIHYFKNIAGENLGVSEVDAELIGVIEITPLALVLKNIIGEKWCEYTGYEQGEGECKVFHLHDVYEGSSDAEYQIEIIGNIYQNPELLKL